MTPARKEWQTPLYSYANVVSRRVSLFYDLPRPTRCACDQCWQTFIQVKGHPNIVGLLGLCGSTSVSEYFSVRLDDLLLGPGAEHIPISKILSMAVDAARGLQALHEVPGGAIVHYDIKPQQLMLDDNGRVRINDLNMCRFTGTDAAGNLCPFKARASHPGMYVLYVRACLPWSYMNPRATVYDIGLGQIKVTSAQTVDKLYCVGNMPLVGA